MMLFYDVHTHNISDKQTIAIKNLVLSPFDKIVDESDKYYSVGYHPCFISKKVTQKDFFLLETKIQQDNVLAIGEIGLDKTHKQNYNLQKEIFIKQITLSEKYQKPAVLHVVRAYSDVLKIHKEMKVQQCWVYHNFNSSRQIALALIKNNGILSFGKLLFNDKSKAYSLFKEISDDSFLLETDDSSYSIQEIYQKAAEIKKTSIYAIKKNVQCNFVRVFLSK